MSGETTRNQNKLGFSGHVVLPQAVSDPSIIDSVAGFIHEVVPQAYTGVLQSGEPRDNIVWARFEICDFNDSENFPLTSESESDTVPPLLLILGYGTGAQVWSVPASGDATELLSWSQGSVRTFRILKRPREGNDPFAAKRPLAAIVDSASSGPQYCAVNFVSLRTGEIIKNIKFKTPICDVLCNKKSIVITFVEKIAVFDVVTFEDRLTITTCYPSPGVCANPVALGQRWLAYAEKRLTTWQRSSGGCEGDGAQSYTATAIHAVKSLGKGLRDLSGSLTGNVSPPTNNNASQPGVVTIIDIETKSTKERDAENIIAHFVAHVGPIVAMTFDSSGMLLITADKHGHRFHVFRIHPHPVASQLASVHHLYVLHRGETTARVQDIAVSWDSRWIAVSSVRGTTHVFPITPYGGPVTVRTHTTPNVVNKLSRFEKSAGLSDGRGSPLLPEVPSQPLTPRLPPYPHPTTINPLAQLRRSPVPSGEDSPFAAFFASPRAWLPSSPAPQRSPRKVQPVVDSLFIVSSTATLIQYDLEPRCVPGVPKDKISYDTSIELGVEAKAEWCLLKPPYSSTVQPPLGSNNPLLSIPTVYKSQRSSSTPGPLDDFWLSQVEIVTHSGPHRRLWMGPQFSFKSIDPVPLGNDTDSSNDNVNAIKSNPVNMPHRPYLLIEGGGSAGSIDAPHLAGYSSSTEDIAHGETRLREDLADAMLETAHQSGVVGGGRMKAAALERQVNPLGTVITLPSEDGSVAAPPPMLDPPHNMIAPTALTSASPSTVTLAPGSVGESVFSFPGIDTLECFLAGGGETVIKGDKSKGSVSSVVDDAVVCESELKLSETLSAVNVSKEPSDDEVVPGKPPSPQAMSNEEAVILNEEPAKRNKKKTKKKKQEVTEDKPEPTPPESAPQTQTEDAEEEPEMIAKLLGLRRKARLASRASYRSPPPIDPPPPPPSPPPPPPPPSPPMLPPPSPVRPTRRERSKRIKMSEVMPLPEKKKSPSPEKEEPKDTPPAFKEDSDSSDEVAHNREKPVDSETPPMLKTKSKSESTLDVEKSDYETCSEKKSDSSIESFPETRRASAHRTCPVKSWSNVVKEASAPASTSKNSGGGTNEDRDSVYESCNDDESPANIAGGCQSEADALPETTELDESSSGGSRAPTAESSSSNTEERPEEEAGVSPVVVVKKVKKQKKKWR